MTRTITIGILFCLVVYQQGASVRWPIGPSFILNSHSKQQQRLYYNNLGIRLDCSAIGEPSPVLTWLRTNGTDDRPSAFVRSSELIDVYENGSLFIRPFREYSKVIHAGTFVCRAENAAGSVQTTPIQLKPQIYDSFEIEVKNTFGFEASAVVLACDISPPSAISYVQIIGWLEKENNQIHQLDLHPRTKYNLLSNKNLIIHNISKSDDNRSYACVVNNRIDNDTRESRFKPLRVRDPSPFGPELSVLNNTEYRARIGDLVELPCGISSLPSRARISWWKNGREIEHDKRHLYDHSLMLQITPSSNDSGIYACRIDDESGGRMISVTSLKIDIPVQCAMHVQQPNISAGSRVELSCILYPTQTTPPVHWQWYHNSIPVSTPTHLLSIDHITRAHMGMYQCCHIGLTTDSSTCCAQTQLRIIDSPPFIVSAGREQQIVVPAPHVPIEINCTVYGDPLPTIDILRDGERLISNDKIELLPSGDVFARWSIVVSSANETGLYECRAKNRFGIASTHVHVNLERQMPFIRSLNNRTIVAGEESTLACYASGQPHLRLQWINADGITLNSSTQSPVLWTSTNHKSDVFICQASNPFGQISSKLFVSIRIPAKIIFSSSNLTVTKNQTVQIRCSAQGDNNLQLLLTHPRSSQMNILDHANGNIRNLTMTIARAQMSDSGIYQCNARNSYSQDYKSIELVVQNVPDRIEKVFVENAEKILWIKPFDGNANITGYILRVSYLQGTSWSNETQILIDNEDQTNYIFQNLHSKCTISITIEAVNRIGSSPPSDRLHFQSNVKPLFIAPSNLEAVNISSKSITLTWQYPTFQFCHDTSIEYFIEITDEHEQTTLRIRHSTQLILNHLTSFSRYTFTVYAGNELGPGPRSQSLTVQTLESVPRASVTDLTATLLNASTVRVSWAFETKNFVLLNGKFRTFAINTYENYNLSTLQTIETVNATVNLHNLHLASRYYVSVMICNYVNCGPSSEVITIETPNTLFDMSKTIVHPANKSLVLDCPSKSSSWLHEEKPIVNNQYEMLLFDNSSLQILHPKINETNGRYRCGSNLYNVRLYDKPSPVRVKIQYTMTNEIGFKLVYPSERIESVTIVYKAKTESTVEELHISPPVFHIRLANLSCGNLYEIMVYATNEAGFSASEHLIATTDGSIPSLNQPMDLLQSVSDTRIVLNMTRWIVNECSILSYDVDVLAVLNTTEEIFNRYLSVVKEMKEIFIDNLISNHDYELRITAHSQAGDSTYLIRVRTKADSTTLGQSSKANKRSNEHLIAVIITGSFLFSFVCFTIAFIIVKMCRRHLKKADLNGQSKKLKPVLCPSYSTKHHHRHYHGAWVKSENEFTIKSYTIPSKDHDRRPYSYASEDSQGNINPYAVTGCTQNDHGSFWRETKHAHYTADPHPPTSPIERYFRPIILESSFFDDPETTTKRNPLVPVVASHTSPSSYLQNQYHPPSSALSAMSSSQGELFSAFTLIPPSKQPTLNTKRLQNHNHILADQSSSSADSGVHSSYTQSPIVKHSSRKCQLHGFPFDRPSSANTNDEQDRHLYATYDRQFAFMTTPSIVQPAVIRHHQEQYSLV